MSKVTEEEAVFRSHIDGRLLAISPERAVAIQEALGSDVAMVLDHVVALPNEPAVVRDATRADRSAGPPAAARRPAAADQALFAIVQGGLDADLRAECAEELAASWTFPAMPWAGLSVGEAPAEMYRMLDATVPAAAGRPAALPDGRGPAGRPAGGRSPGHRPVRLRDAHPQRPQRHGLYRCRADAAAKSAV